MRWRSSKKKKTRTNLLVGVGVDDNHNRFRPVVDPALETLLEPRLGHVHGDDHRHHLRRDWDVSLLELLRDGYRFVEQAGNCFQNQVGSPTPDTDPQRQEQHRVEVEPRRVTFLERHSATGGSSKLSLLRRDALLLPPIPKRPRYTKLLLRAQGGRTEQFERKAVLELRLLLASGSRE